MADEPLGLVLECVDSGPVLVSGVIKLESSGALSRRSLFDSCRSAISWRLLWERKVSNCFKPLSCAGGEGKDVPEASGKHSMLKLEYTNQGGDTQEEAAMLRLEVWQHHSGQLHPMPHEQVACDV